MKLNTTLTLGSLFDGSGGFPLGGLLAGITPVWASEIEPFPIRVTTKRLPFMKHYGDISQMVVSFLPVYHWCLPFFFQPYSTGSCCH